MIKNIIVVILLVGIVASAPAKGIYLFIYLSLISLFVYLSLFFIIIGSRTFWSPPNDYGDDEDVCANFDCPAGQLCVPEEVVVRHP